MATKLPFFHFLSSFLILLGCSMFVGHAQPQLLLDPWTDVMTEHGSPREFVEMNGMLYFMADDQQGTNLWRSDGTPAGTYIIERQIYEFGGMAVDNINNWLYVGVANCESGTELAKTDGTPGNLQVVKEVGAGAAGAAPLNIVAANGKVWFNSRLGEQPGLWVSDGTASGTIRVMRTYEVGYLYEIRDLVPFGDKLVFSARDIPGNYELWISDGTVNGTMPLLDFQNNEWRFFPTGFKEFNNTMYFFGLDQNNNVELWETMGTASSTAMVGHAGNGSTWPDPPYYELLELNDSLYFLAIDFGQNPYSLKKLNATTGDITPIQNFGSTRPRNFFDLQDELLVVLIQAGNYEFWLSDGTASGTGLFDVFNVLPRGFAQMDSLLIFAQGDFLWRTNGTSAGTFAIDHGAGYWSKPGTSIEYNGQLFFSGKIPESTGSSLSNNGVELYKTDGKATISFVKDTDANPAFTDISLLGELNGNQIYLAQADNPFFGLWISDGTPGGSYSLIDLAAQNPISEYSDVNIGSVAVWDSVLYFSFCNGDQFELWGTDGTQAGTKPYIRTEMPTQPFGPSPCTLNETGDMFVYNGELYFRGAVILNQGMELYKLSDPSSPAELVKDIYPGINSGDPSSLYELNGSLIFLATTSTDGTEPWISDGTSAGTHILKDIRPGVSSSSFKDFRSWSEKDIAGNYLFFGANDGSTGFELWVTDGTSQGTALIQNIYPGGRSSSPRTFHSLGNKMIFFADKANYGWEPWVSDGTVLGTKMLKDIFPGFLSSVDPNNPEIIWGNDSLVFFSAFDGVNGRELWRTDGTTVGTYMLKDIIPGPECSDPEAFCESDELIYFVTRNDSLRATIWQSDGTEAGTRMVDGFSASSPFEFIWDLNVVDSTLFFTAAHHQDGSALYSMDISAWPTAIRRVSAIQSHDIFPNPTTDVLNIRTEDLLLGDVKLTILDMSGRIVLNQQRFVHASQNELQVRTSELLEGVYLLVLRSGESHFSQKFVVRRN